MTNIYVARVVKEVACKVVEGNITQLTIQLFSSLKYLGVLLFSFVFIPPYLPNHLVYVLHSIRKK